MVSYQLEAAQDDETGETGLRFDLPHIDYPTVANEGLLIAHDILEHVNGINKIGTIADELQALSGVWLTRGQHGVMRQDRIGSAYTPEQNVLSDVYNMFTMVSMGSASLISRPAPEAMHIDVEWVIEELTLDSLIEYHESETGEECTTDQAQDYLNTTLYHFNAGAEQWFKTHADIIANYGEWGVNQLFWTIANELEPHAKHCEGYERLQINIDRDELTVEVLDLNELEYEEDEIHY